MEKGMVLDLPFQRRLKGLRAVRRDGGYEQLGKKMQKGHSGCFKYSCSA